MLSKKLIVAMMFILTLAAGNVQAGGDVARGQELAVDCADCHGDDGLGDEDSPAKTHPRLPAWTRQLTSKNCRLSSLVSG